MCANPTKSNTHRIPDRNSVSTSFLGIKSEYPISFTKPRSTRWVLLSLPTEPPKGGLKSTALLTSSPSLGINPGGTDPGGHWQTSVSEFWTTEKVLESWLFFKAHCYSRIDAMQCAGVSEQVVPYFSHAGLAVTVITVIPAQALKSTVSWENRHHV